MSPFRIRLCNDEEGKRGSPGSVEGGPLEDLDPAVEDVEESQEALGARGSVRPRPGGPTSKLQIGSTTFEKNGLIGKCEAEEGCGHKKQARFVLGGKLDVCGFSGIGSRDLKTIKRRIMRIININTMEGGVTKIRVTCVCENINLVRTNLYQNKKKCGQTQFTKLYVKL